MAFIGYYEFSLLGVTRLGIFSPGVAENTYSVQIFELTVQELQPLDEEHLRYVASFELQTSDQLPSRHRIRQLL